MMPTSNESVLFIQIPCLNEEKTLHKVIADLPRKIEGFSRIYTLVIDDGSTDATFEVAQQQGVDYILRNPSNMGLAQSFVRGLETCLYLGADVVVNTDGDNQYRGSDIVRLVEPLRNKQAMMVVGCRDISNHAEFSRIKKGIQKFGSKIVKLLSGYDIPDATSGFRAMDRLALLRMTIMSDFSYTIETLLQAQPANLNVQWVSIAVNKKARESRLFTSMTSFIYQQVKTILVVSMLYRPAKLFNWIVCTSILIAIFLGARITYHLWMVEEVTQKFKIGSGLTMFFLLIVAFSSLIASLISLAMTGQNHQIEDIRMQIRNISLKDRIFPQHLQIFKSTKLFYWQRVDSKTMDPSDSLPTYSEIQSAIE